jgi:hypothetical protein
MRFPGDEEAPQILPSLAGQLLKVYCRLFDTFITPAHRTFACVCAKKFYNNSGIELCSARQAYACMNAAGVDVEFA